MPAATPEEICEMFSRHMREGDLDSVLAVYDSEAVFLNRAGEIRRVQAELREELAPFAAARAVFDYRTGPVIQTGDIALMHTHWNIQFQEQRLSLDAIEVARRQADGSWRWLIGDPFTVGRRTAS